MEAETSIVGFSILIVHFEQALCFYKRVEGNKFADGTIGQRAIMNYCCIWLHKNTVLTSELTEFSTLIENHLNAYIEIGKF